MAGESFVSLSRVGPEQREDDALWRAQIEQLCHCAYSSGYHYCNYREDLIWSF